MANAPWYGSLYTLLPIIMIVILSAAVLITSLIDRRRSAPTLDTSCAVKTARDIVITMDLPIAGDGERIMVYRTIVVRRIRGANV